MKINYLFKCINIPIASQEVRDIRGALVEYTISGNKDEVDIWNLKMSLSRNGYAYVGMRIA